MSCSNSSAVCRIASKCRGRCAVPAFERAAEARGVSKSQGKRGRLYAHAVQTANGLTLQRVHVGGQRRLHLGEDFGGVAQEQGDEPPRHVHVAHGQRQHLGEGLGDRLGGRPGGWRLGSGLRGAEPRGRRWPRDHLWRVGGRRVRYWIGGRL